MNGQFVRLVGLVARRDYLRTVGRRSFLAATLLLPLAMVFLFLFSRALTGGVLSGQGDGPVLVVNESSVALVAQPALTPHVVLVTRTDAESRLAAHAADEFYLIPSTWPAQPELQIVSLPSANGGQPLGVLGRQESAKAEVDLLLRTSLVRAAGIPESTIGQLLTPISYQSVTTTGQPVSEASAVAGFIVPYVFTLIFVLSIFLTSGYLLQSVTEEKENRVVEIVLSSIPALPLMAGKVVGLGAAGLTQVAIWVGTALVAIPIVNQQFSIDVSIPVPSLVLAVLVFCLGYLSYGAIFAAVGSVATGGREAQQYSSIFGFFAVIPLIATPVFLSDPNSALVWVLALLPLTGPAALLELLSLPGAPPLLIALSLAVQTLYVILAVVVAGRIFRATILLYGTRPSVQAIAQAVFARS